MLCFGDIGQSVEALGAFWASIIAWGFHSNFKVIYDQYTIFENARLHSSNINTPPPPQKSGFPSGWFFFFLCFEVLAWVHIFAVNKRGCKHLCLLKWLTLNQWNRSSYRSCTNVSAAISPMKPSTKPDQGTLLSCGGWHGYDITHCRASTKLPVIW